MIGVDNLIRVRFSYTFYQLDTVEYGNVTSN